jgi:hypothetical protein
MVFLTVVKFISGLLINCICLPRADNTLNAVATWILGTSATLVLTYLPDVISWLRYDFCLGVDSTVKTLITY